MNFNADFRLEWKPDTMTNIIFRPNISWGKSESGSWSQSGTFNEDPFTLVPNPNDYLDLAALAQMDLNEDDDPLKSIRVNTSNNLSSSEGNSLSANATLQVNRRLNARGRNITLRGRLGYGDNESEQYSSNDTRYFLTTGDVPREMIGYAVTLLPPAITITTMRSSHIVNLLLVPPSCNSAISSSTIIGKVTRVPTIWLLRIANGNWVIRCLPIMPIIKTMPRVSMPSIRLLNMKLCWGCASSVLSTGLMPGFLFNRRILN